MKNAAAVAVMLALFTAPALADDNTQTTTANTLVVVTPNAPVIIQQGQGPSGQLGQAQETEMPPAPPAAPAAPQNEDWNNVSHINGSIVPVGERGAYLKAFKKTNISTNPLGFIYKSYSISASYAVSNNIVLRGDLSAGWQAESSDGVEIGISAPIYFRRAYSGPFIEPGLLMRSFKQTDSNYDYATNTSTDTMSTKSSMLVEMMVGWHWSFDSGLNLAVACGAAREIGNNTTSNSSDPYASSSSEAVHPVGYFRVGYSF